MGGLAKFAQNHSPYLRIADNDEVEVIYLGYKEIDDERNPGKTKIRYTMKVGGEEKWFDSGSVAVAMALDRVEEGDKIVVQKTVSSGKIRYSIKEPEIKKEPADE